MKIIKYFFEYIFVSTFFFIFKIVGYRNASNLGEIIGKIFGPFFRSNSRIQNNLKNSNIGNSENDRKKIISSMWGNYGRIFAEYPYIEKFKNDSLKKYIKINGAEVLEDIKKNKKQVIFISGHFNNFELMAMEIEKHGIDVAAIYRPLNNIFLNKKMEKIRTNYICKKQIKKGRSGTREMLELFRNGSSIALMIDQRVSEGISVNFFNRKCLTTTIPAQLIRKYNCGIVPVYIERKNNINFEISFSKIIEFEKSNSVENITLELNSILESMILKNIDQWIWSHNRWK
ncbi:MAG: lysophospholipid acyltransferase family protein [Candidatus Pelagibacter sp.]